MNVRLFLKMVAAGMAAAFLMAAPTVAETSPEEAAYDAVLADIFEMTPDGGVGNFVLEPRADAEEAVARLVALSEDGNPYASNMLSRLYRDGEILLPPSVELEIMYAERAMNQSRALSDERLIQVNTLNYAETLSRHIPVHDPDWRWVENLSRNALETDDAELARTAAGLVGIAILFREDFETRMPEAEPYLRTAAAGSEADARVIWLLGRGLYTGWFGEPDQREACDFFERAAELGVTPAFWFWGMCLLNYGADEDREEQAFVWVRNAAEAGDSNAYLSLAVMYALGQGVEQSDVRAAQTYDYVVRLHGLEMAHAMRGLGAMYALQGYGDDPVFGYVLLELAAEGGDQNASVVLRNHPPPTHLQAEIIARKPEVMSEYGL